MTPAARRELTVAVLLCLAGAGLVLLAATRAWARVGVVETALAPARVLDVLGTDVAPGVRALGLVGLAGVVALAATRRTGRTVVGLLLAAAGAGVVAAVVGADRGAAAAARLAEVGGQAAGPPTGTAWPPVAVVGGVLVALAGAVVTARGRRWAALSSRYEVPVAGAPAVSTGPQGRAGSTRLAGSEAPTGPDAAAPAWPTPTEPAPVPPAPGPPASGPPASGPPASGRPAPGSSAPVSPERAERELWESLDRGEDPTGRC